MRCPASASSTDKLPVPQPRVRHLAAGQGNERQDKLRPGPADAGIQQAVIGFPVEVRRLTVPVLACCVDHADSLPRTPDSNSCPGPSLPDGGTPLFWKG